MAGKPCRKSKPCDSISGHASNSVSSAAGKIAILLFIPASGCDLISTDPRISNASGFLQDVSAEVGLNVKHQPCVEGSYYMPESIGSGCAFLDFDNDGDLDIYLLNGSWQGRRHEDRPAVTNLLFRQEGDEKFVDVTTSSRLGDTGYGMGVAVGDINNDGFVDVYVSNVGQDALYVNNGDGTFDNVTSQAGIDNSEWGCSVVFFDYNRDTFLDIFITNYVAFDPA